VVLTPTACNAACVAVAAEELKATVDELGMKKTDLPLAFDASNAGPGAWNDGTFRLLSMNDFSSSCWLWVSPDGSFVPLATLLPDPLLPDPPVAADAELFEEELHAETTIDAVTIANAASRILRARLLICSTLLDLVNRYLLANDGVSGLGPRG
jgi:hypothetical protein